MSCIECGKTHQIGGAVSSEPARVEEAVRVLAEGSGLDLATACSVVLSIVTLEEASDMRERIEACMDRRGDGQKQHPERPRSRPQWARLANRESRPAPDFVVPCIDPPRRSRVPVAIACALSALVVLATVWMLGQSPGTADTVQTERQRRLLEFVTIERNDFGQISRVEAHDARLVLLGYCNADPADPGCYPSGVALGPRSERRERLGLFRLEPDGERTYAIEIRRAGVAQGWVAGGTDEAIRFAETSTPTDSLLIPADY
ncbi:MAG: hypothetical protein GY716_15615 [bacterium]|nr:hypothetical protein [bacterium]